MAGSALVLGGGGITGIAWEIGILTGLAEAGVELTHADTVIGTSAGSVAGAQVTSGIALDKLFDTQLADATGEIAVLMSKATMVRFGMAMLRSRDARKVRKAVGKLAMRKKTMPEAERRKIMEARLPVHSWPEQRLLITAVDAESGEFEMFDSTSGVSLVDAVGASCAVPGVWPPVTIDGRRWIDGGVRSTVNADLAKGCDPVIVLAPLTTGFGPMAGAAPQIAELEKDSTVVLVAPDAEARKAFGKNVLDPANRAASARAGYAQAKNEAAALRAVWPS